MNDDPEKTLVPGEPEEDFQNCKGQCGYTEWCGPCIEERRRIQREKELERIRRRDSEDQPT